MVEWDSDYARNLVSHAQPTAIWTGPKQRLSVPFFRT